MTIITMAKPMKKMIIFRGSEGLQLLTHPLGHSHHFVAWQMLEQLDSSLL